MFVWVVFPDWFVLVVFYFRPTHFYVYHYAWKTNLLKECKILKGRRFEAISPLKLVSDKGAMFIPKHTLNNGREYFFFDLVTHCS